MREPRTRLPLRRARSDSPEMPAPLVAGVCSGLSVHTGLPVDLVRALIAAFSLFFGAGIMLYLWLLATVPLDDPDLDSGAEGPVKRLQTPLARTAKDSRNQAVGGQLLLAGAVLVVASVVLIVSLNFFEVGLDNLLAGIALFGGIALVWMQVPNLENWRSPKVWLVTTAGVLLVLLSVVLFLNRPGKYSTFTFGALMGVLTIGALIVVLSPLWFGMLNRMATARSREARETERADIAAHLHDSVLQTLTLIRASADDPIRVRSLALTQERELRAWLYTGREDPGQSVAQILRDRVESAETTYGVEVSVVTVGDAVPGPAELAAVAAAGEATANALRHGAPPVSVYLEVSPDRIEIFVKDSGQGFDPDEIPEDRHGVRDSILGRIERVDGQASIRSRTSGVPGTEIRIQVPRTVQSE